MSNVPSNIPFTDINAGHTISEMVDIINTNFDLVNLKGGGPEGMQGIQGVLGFSGIQGLQGIQGRRGAGWVTQSNMGDAEDGDLYLAPNGDVQSYNEGTWTTEYQLLDNVISPFTLTGTTIHPVDPTNKTVLGGSNSATNSTLNIVGSDTAISISGGGTIADLKVDGGAFVVESDQVSLKTSNTTLTLYGDNRILVSPLAGLTNDNTIHPFITVNSLGELTHQSNWEWGVVNESVVPNDTLNNCYVGDETHLLDGLWMDENSNINFKTDTDTSYLKINSKTTGENLKNVVKVSKNGICVGSYSNNQNLNYDTENSGIYVAGGTSQKCGQITLVGPSVGNVGYVNFDSVEPTGTNANTPTYTLNVNDTQNNNIKDNSPLITLKPNSTNFSANTLHIKGGTHTNGKGYDVLIDGGDSRGEWNQKEKTGGDVYIAGGSNRNNSSNGNEIRGSLYNFGDVVIGLNPNNHPSLRSGSATYASTRGVSKDKISSVDFYDICNFTAHGNKIVLDSDANNRTVNGYPSNGSCPWLNDINQATLKFNGLTTIYKNNPVAINYVDAFMHQMISGVYSTSVMYYMSGGTLQTKRGVSIYSLLNSSEYSSLASGTTSGNSKYRTVFSNITTSWQKIGNVVNCQTRVDLYFVINEYGEIAIMEPIRYYDTSSEGIKPDLYAYDNIVKNGIITNVELPICLYKTNTSGILRPSYVYGSGCTYTEKTNIIGMRIKTTDNYFLNNTTVSVNNNTAYTNPQHVKPFSTSNTDCSTNKHDSNGKLKEQFSVSGNKNISKGYLKTDNILQGNDANYCLLTPRANSTYIIPEYISTVKVNEGAANEDTKRKFVPLTKAYTSLNLNYSYLLNTGFEETIHNDFIYMDGTSSGWVDVGEIGNQAQAQNQEFYQQVN